MSFSSEVKQELAELPADKPCCRAALAYGLLEFGHAFTGSRMSLQTEHAAVAHLYSALAADVMLKEQGLDRVSATAEQLAAVDTAAAPWGILSVLLIFFVGGGLYFFVLPRYLEKK